METRKKMLSDRKKDAEELGMVTYIKNSSKRRETPERPRCRKTMGWEKALYEMHLFGDRNVVKLIVALHHIMTEMLLN